MLVVTLVLLIIILPATFYIPVVQDWVCGIVVSYLNDTDQEHSYSIGKVRIGFPLQLRVENVEVRDRYSGHRLIHVGALQTGLDDIPIHQPYFVLNRLKVQEISLGMEPLTESVSLNGRISMLDVTRIEYDPNTNLLRIREALLDHPEVHIGIGPSEPDTTQSAPWDIVIHKAVVSQGQLCLEMNDSVLPVLPDSLVITPLPYLDYNHLSISGLNAEAERITYNPDLIYAEVNLLQGKEENSLVQLDQLAVNFRMQENIIEAQQIDLQLSPADYLRGDLMLHLGMFDSIPAGALQTNLQLAIDSGNMVRLVSPYIEGLQQGWVSPQTSASVKGRLTPDSLDLRELALQIPQHVDLRLEGAGTQIFDNEHRHAALTVKGEMLRSDCLLSAFVAPHGQRSYQLPDSLEIDAEMGQKEQSFMGRINLLQNQHPVVKGEARYDFSTEKYHVVADIQGLDVSQFMPQIAVNHLAARINADGRHLRFPSLYTSLDVQLEMDTLLYQNPAGQPEQLQGIRATASLKKGQYVAEIHSEHPYLMLDTQLEGFYLKDSLSVNGYIDLPLACIDRLPYGLATQGLGDLGFRSTVRGAYNWGDIANVSLRIDSLTYSDENNHTRFDNIQVDITSEPGLLDADLKGGDASLCINVNRGVSELAGLVDTLQSEFNRQLDCFSFDFSRLRNCLPQTNVDLEMGQENPFYQALEYQTGYTFQSANLKLRNTHELKVDGEVIALADGSGTIDYDTIAVHVNPCGRQTPDAYHYALHATHIDPRARKSYDVHCDGKLMPDSLTAALSYINGHYLTLYDVAASLAVADDSITIHLEKDPTIYEQPFTVNPDNYFSLMHFRHQSGRHFDTRARMKLQGPRDLSVNLYSRRNERDTLSNRLLFLVRNLDMAYASDVMKSDYDAGGKMNLSASVNLYSDSITAHLRSGVKDFRFGQYNADTLAFDGNYELQNSLHNLDGVMTVDSIVKLALEASLADSIHLNARVEELPLPFVNAFLPSDIQLYGYTSGRLTVDGPDVDHAKIDAGLALVDAGLTFTDLDAMFRFSADTLRVNNKRLTFDDYKIYAAGGSPIRVKGAIDFSKDLANPAINLNVGGDKVRLIDNRRLRLKDQYIYGVLPVAPNIRVRGTMSKLDVTGTVRLLSGTNLNYFMTDDPLQSSSKVDQLVEFVSFRQLDHQFSNTPRRRVAPMQDQADADLNVDLRIEIDKDVKVAAHLAGTDNNRVDIEGGGSLNLQCDAAGNLIMNGTYDVTSGKVDYKLPILPIIKTFDISNSSMVYWEGTEAGNPNISIQAIEHVRATVNDQMGSRLVNFVVTINIAGTLDHLNLTFDCDAPEDGAISAILSALNEEERSKNALMLLLTQTYVGPGNQSSMGLGTANAALNSMLNRQMDSMLGNMKGTNIDLGIDTYSTETGNTRTNYSVKVSQNLFNDRFRATIGGQISSGGEIGQRSGAQLGDMSLEWLIRKDGSHYLKLYRRTNYESVLEGELIETGISYIQERAAYKFRQLLLPTSKKREERLQQIIQEMMAKEEQQEGLILLNNE